MRFLALFLTLVLAANAEASFIEPVGLLPGQQYQLIFVTVDTIAATSTNINTYNAFVQQEAAMDPSLPPGVTWNAVVSTPSMGALNNALAFSVPLYWTNGYEDSFGATGVGSSFNTNQQLYTSPSTHEAGIGNSLMYLMIRYDQYGNYLTAPAGETPQEMGSMGSAAQSPRGSVGNSWYWGNPDPGSFIFTGSTGTGQISQYPAGSSYVTDLAYGVPGWSDWTTNPNISIAANTEQLHLLALSSVIVYQPEPSSGLLAIIAAILLVCFQRGRKCLLLR